MSRSRQRRLLQENRSRPQPIPATTKPQNRTQTRVNPTKPPKPANLLQAVQQAAAPVVSKLQAAQQKFRQATPWFEPVSELIDTAAAKADYLPSEIAGTGAAILAQRAGVHPAVLLPLGLLTGAVHKAGPKAGQFKASGAAATHKHNDLIEAMGEHVWKQQKPGATSASTKGIPPVLLPDGTVMSWKNQGQSKFNPAVKGGLTPQFNPPVPGRSYPSVDDVVTSKPLPNVSTKVQAPKPAPIPPTANKSPDLAQRRFTPLDKDPTIKESRSQIDKRVRNPALPRDLAPGKGPSDTAPPVPLGELNRDRVTDSPTRGQLAIGPYEPGTARAGQAYANSHLSVDGSGVAQPFKVAETQAHHSTSPLKDAGDFTRGFTDEQMAIFRAKTEAAGVYAGDTQLNTAYLRQPYHQGNKVWPEAKQSAVHPNLQSRVLEAKASQDRWAHMTPQERLDNIDYFIEDALLGQRLAQEAEFAQTLLQAGNNAFNNPFGGNLSQSVLAPLNKTNLVEIANKRRKARTTLKDKMAERHRNNTK